MTEHRLLATRANLHGTYFRENTPVLRVANGDIINFQTLEVGWRTEKVVAGKELSSISPRDPVKDNGPALTGPVYVEGAKPGMTLEIKFLSIETGPWGWTSAGGPGHITPGITGIDQDKASLFWEIDVFKKTVTNQLGHRVPLQAFLGCVGLASRDPQREPGWKPHPRTGGNLDAKVLTVGNSLFLPVEVEGGLLSVGDAHANQGDGEVSGRGVECPTEESRLQVVLHPDQVITSPRARCGDSWVTFGLAETLDEAADLAMNAMLDLLTEMTNLTRSEALALSSAIVDLRITQMVNPLKGVHAVLHRLPAHKR